MRQKCKETLNWIQIIHCMTRQSKMLSQQQTTLESTADDMWHCSTNKSRARWGMWKPLIWGKCDLRIHKLLPLLGGGCNLGIKGVHQSLQHQQEQHSKVPSLTQVSSWRFWWVSCLCMISNTDKLKTIYIYIYIYINTHTYIGKVVIYTFKL